MRSVHALRHTTGMIRMYWATMDGSKRLVLVPSLSVFPAKTCDTTTKVRRKSALMTNDSASRRLFDLVPPLALDFMSGVCAPIQAAGHLKGLDVLRRSQATGALSDDARQTHLLLQVDLLFPKSQPVSVVYGQYRGFIRQRFFPRPQSRGSCHGWRRSRH